jgi:hypothetical protein
MTELLHRAVDTLLGAFRESLVRPRDTGSTVLTEITAILQTWPKPFPADVPAEPHRLVVCRHLDAALADASRGREAALARAIAPVIERLRWTYSYPFQPRWPNLASNIGFAQLIGPSGLVDNEHLHIGLTLMAPHTYYPMHAHPAIETYLVLSGTALWRVSGTAFAAQPSGAIIVHTTDIGHAMETRDAPLLALFVWRGDLFTPPVYVEEDS